MSAFELELDLLLEALYRKYHQDFRGYSRAALRRRVQHALGRFDCSSVSQLQHRALHEPLLFAQLLELLTIKVSDLFRDPAYYCALRESVVPVLGTYPSIKIWIAGCGTGEELWSLAILFHEEGLLDRALFYATDISPDALQAAESGVYALHRIPGFSRNYTAAGGRASLADYYVSDVHAASFSRRLQPKVVFADHSLATDTVFSEVHFVSCRNVLIYFDRTLQDRAIGLFDEALVRRGFLGLGSKESLRASRHVERFEPLCAAERLYRKR